MCYLMVYSLHVLYNVYKKTYLVIKLSNHVKQHDYEDLV